MFRVIAKGAIAVAAVGALFYGSSGTAAQAAEPAVVPSVTVRYADLNLNTSAGVRELYARLRAAARRVCNVGAATGLVNVMAARGCYDDVLSTAVADARLPTLTALHRDERARDGHERS